MINTEIFLTEIQFDLYKGGKGGRCKSVRCQFQYSLISDFLLIFLLPIKVCLHLLSISSRYLQNFFEAGYCILMSGSRTSSCCGAAFSFVSEPIYFVNKMLSQSVKHYTRLSFFSFLVVLNDFLLAILTKFVNSVF